MNFVSLLPPDWVKINLHLSPHLPEIWRGGREKKDSKYTLVRRKSEDEKEKHDVNNEAEEGEATRVSERSERMRGQHVQLLS